MTQVSRPSETWKSAEQAVSQAAIDQADISKSNELLNRQPAAIQAYQSGMQQGLQAVKQWLTQEQMYSGLPVTALQDQIQLHLTDQGLGLSVAIERAVLGYLQHSLAVHHPYCVAHLHCPTLVVSQVAELLINASNQSLDSWDQSPSASVMEVKLMTWLRSRLGYALGDAGVFTSGGTQSNLMGLLLARDHIVQQVWRRRVQTDGLPADHHRIKVICSANAHFSVQKNMALLGLGLGSVVSVPVNAKGQMQTSILSEVVTQVQQDGAVIAAIVATAGTTDSGAIDPLLEIAKIATQHGIWLHVDAAWGGALLLSKHYRHWLDGIEQADSVTLDFHKHFFQPISCGAFLLKDPAHYQLMHYQADYLNSAFDESQGVPNLVAKSLQTTRRFDALKLWMSLEALGLDRFSQLIEHGIRLAQQIAPIIQQTAEMTLLQSPQLSSVLFRVTPTALHHSHWDLFNQALADRLLAAGHANIGVTRFQDLTSLKLTLLNPSIQLSDIQQLLSLIQQQAKQLLATASESLA